LIVYFVPLLDLGWAYSLLMLGVWGQVVLIPLTILSEAGVLRWLLPGARPIRDSFLMNLVSGLLGFLGLALGGPSFFGIAEFFSTRTGGDYYTASVLAEAAFLLTIMGISWALSVVVEGGVLAALLRGRPGRRVWLVSLVANGVSYAAMLLILFVARWTGIV
jgi:hypothetical protein